MNPLQIDQIVQDYGHQATLWMQQLWLVSWQGGIFILVVWFVCRLFPQLPAKTQRWLWRIVYCKLLIGLFWLAPISLPLITPQSSVVRDLNVPIHTRVATGQYRQAATPDPIVAPSSRNLDLVATAITAESQQQLQHKTPQGRPPSALGMKLNELYLQGVLPNDAETFFIIVVDIVWASGVFCCLVALLLQVVRLRQLRMRARSLAGTSLAAVTEELANQIGLRRCPRVVASHDAEAPLITGLLRPVIVIPELALNSYSAADLRLILMHELQHIRAGDLWWMALAAITEMFFFFNPLVWLAGRNFSLVREAACDSAVLQASDTPAPEYARLLLMIVTAKPKRETFIATLGAAVGYRVLKRRLALLQFAYGDAIRPGLRLTLVVLSLCGGVFLVPWRITASGSIVQPPRYGAFAIDNWMLAPGNELHGGTFSDAPMIGETFALPGQPQHLLASQIATIDTHGYHLQMRDLGPVEWRWKMVRNDGTVVWGPKQSYPWIAGPIPDQTPRDTRLHAQLHRTNQRGALHMTSDFPRGSGSMGNTMVFYSGELPAAGSSIQVSFHQAWFSRNFKITFIGTLPGGTYSTAVSFNDAGYVTGSADASDGTEHGYLWYKGAMQDLGLGHPQVINVHNQIVGYYTTPAGHKRACLWQNGARVDLGTLGGADSMANDINSVGNIVGEALNADGVPHAFLYTNGKMSDLNDHVQFGTRLVLTSADCIFYSGAELIAYGALPQEAQSDHAAFQCRVFRLSPE